MNGARHIAEPQFSYVFVPEPNRTPTELPQFDRELISPKLLPIHFPDYTQGELSQIFLNLCTANQINISDTGLAKLNKYLADVNPIGEHGNARFIRNLFEKMFASLSNRAASDGVIEIDELKEFTHLDVPTAEPRKTALGFGPS